MGFVFYDVLQKVTIIHHARSVYNTLGLTLGFYIMAQEDH